MPRALQMGVLDAPSQMTSAEESLLVETSSNMVGVTHGARVWYMSARPFLDASLISLVVRYSYYGNP